MAFTSTNERTYAYFSFSESNWSTYSSSNVVNVSGHVYNLAKEYWFKEELVTNKIKNYAQTFIFDKLTSIMGNVSNCDIIITGNSWNSGDLVFYGYSNDFFEEYRLKHLRYELGKILRRVPYLSKITIFADKKEDNKTNICNCRHSRTNWTPLKIITEKLEKIEGRVVGSTSEKWVEEEKHYEIDKKEDKSRGPRSENITGYSAYHG